MTPSARLTFIVHGLVQARLALATAAKLGVPIYLRSAEGAGLSLGAPWFREMVAAAIASSPPVDVIAVLDCGPYAGAALAAFRRNVAFVCVEVAPAIEQRLARIALNWGEGSLPPIASSR
jgi:hypothetical protein